MNMNARAVTLKEGLERVTRHTIQIAVLGIERSGTHSRVFERKCETAEVVMTAILRETEDGLVMSPQLIVAIPRIDIG